ncbi:MAG: hypothetical protein ACTHNH_05235 [Mesorhizobium sp.]
MKAGGRGMPWESEKAEFPALLLAEVGSPVIDLLAQPHRLEMSVVGRRQRMVYFPDLLLTVEEGFLHLLTKGVPFGRAVVEWRPDPRRCPHPSKLVVEVKDDADGRMNDPIYREKLRLAREVYAIAGYSFIQIVRSVDIDCVDRRIINDVLLDKRTVITASEVGRAVRYLRSQGGRGTLGGLIDVLGGGTLARAVAKALHVRRILSIDLTGPLQHSSWVWLIRPYGLEGCYAN